MPGTGKFNRLRWTKHIIERFGAEVMLDEMKFQHMSELATKVARKKADREIADESGRYVWPETAEPVLTVVWDWAYPPRHPAFSTMRAVLASGGVTHDRVAHVWAVPRELRRPALAEEIAEFRSRTIAAVQAANSQDVLLVGASAIKLWRPDMPVMQVTGRTFRWRIRNQDYRVFPIMHPGAVINDKSNMALWRLSLKSLSRAIYQGVTAWETSCIVDCGRDVEIYDENAVPYCAEHFNPNNTANKEKEWKKKAKDRNQGEMFDGS